LNNKIKIIIAIAFILGGLLTTAVFLLQGTGEELKFDEKAIEESLESQELKQGRLLWMEYLSCYWSWQCSNNPEDEPCVVAREKGIMISTIEECASNEDWEKQKEIFGIE